MQSKRNCPKIFYLEKTLRTAFLFDLDGTVTREEILPKIAKYAGLEDEIKLLTTLTLDGVIPFADSFKLRCAILKSISLKAVQHVVKHIQIFPHIENFITKNKKQCCIVTGNLDIWIHPIAENLGCTFFSSKAVVKEDRLLGIDRILNKADPVYDLRSNFDRIVVIGDSYNDIPMFECADICIAFGATHQPIKKLIEISDYVVYDQEALCRLLTMLL